MSLRDDLLFQLKEFRVWKADVDRTALVKGHRAIKVTIYCRDQDPSEFTFAGGNEMTTRHMLGVISLHLERKRQ